MATLQDRIENALNESRILILGMQILVGFGFRTFFEPGINGMSRTARLLELSSVALMLVGLGLFLAPVPYHVIVYQGRDTAAMHRFASAMVTCGLIPFCFSFGLSAYLGANQFLRSPWTWLFGVSALLMTGWFWFGLEIWVRRRAPGHVHAHGLYDPLRGTDISKEEPISLTERIKQVLIECRMVLPGAQALVGFQLIIMCMTEFTKIPFAWKMTHLSSLALVAVSTVLLMTPAAHHRIVERGDDSEKFHRFASRILLAAMVFLALGMCTDFSVVSRISGLAAIPSTAISAAFLLFSFGLWFAYTLWRRQQNERRSAEPATVRRAA
jgi:hypothetical protein